MPTKLQIDLAVRQEVLAPFVEQQPYAGPGDLHALRDEPRHPERGRGLGVGVEVAAPRVRAHQLLGHVAMTRAVRS